MSDKWMNLGYDNQDLKPYSEPTPDFKDERRIGKEFIKASTYRCIPLFDYVVQNVIPTFFMFRNYASNGIFKR